MAVRLHYVLGEFSKPEEMLAAARALRKAGFLHIDTHSPYPVEGYEEALGLPQSPVALLTLIGGLGGACLGYLMQWWCNGVDFPIVVGGRPPLGPSTWWLPNDIPITFELGVLFGSFAAFFGVFILSGLPRPHHPAFELEAFRTASVDRFWVSVATDAPDQDGPRIIADLKAAGASRVSTVSETEDAFVRQEDAGQ